MNRSTPASEKNTEFEGIGEEFVAALEAATGMQQPAYYTNHMDSQQVLEGFSRILMTSRPDRGLEVLSRSGVLSQVIPEVAAMVGFGEGVRHKDVWAHTKQVVRQTPMRLLVRWAGLLHDIGKVPTRRFHPDGQVTFIGHPEIGARMFERICRRIPFPKDAKSGLRFLIAAHLRAAAYDESWTDSAVRRFARDAGSVLDDLLDLARADITSKYEEKVRRGLRQINSLDARIRSLEAEDAKPVPLPKGLGHELIRRFKISPGPSLGRLMNNLKAEVEAGNLVAQGEFSVYVDYIKSKKELLKLTSQ